MKEKVICNIPIFNHLMKNEKKCIEKLFLCKEFEKKELIFSPNSQEQILIVCTGKVKIYRLSDSGKEHLFRIIKEGDCEGENYLFNGKNTMFYGEAIENSKICMIYNSELRKILYDYPQLSYELLKINTKKTMDLEIQVKLLSINNISNRIALYLIHLSRITNFVEESYTITLPMTKKEVASYLFICPETFSRKLKDFENKQLIKRKKNKVTLLKKFGETYTNLI